MAVARSSHVTQAARLLNLTQPAVTHQIRQLEEAVGTRLLRKEGRRIVLTGDGESLFAEIMPMMGELEAALMRIRRRKSGELRGVVRIATLQSYNSSLIVEAAFRLANIHPGIRLVSREMAANAIETAVTTGQADLGLTFQVRRSASLRVEVLARECLLAVFGVDASLVPETVVSLEDLTRFKLALMPREFALRALIDDLAAAKGLNLNVGFESSNLSALIDFARMTRSAAIIPQCAARSAQNLVVRKLDATTRQVTLITASDVRSETVQAVVDAIAQTAQSTMSGFDGESVRALPSREVS